VEDGVWEFMMQKWQWEEQAVANEGWLVAVDWGGLGYCVSTEKYVWLRGKICRGRKSLWIDMKAEIVVFWLVLNWVGRQW